MTPSHPHPREALARDLRRLGVGAGDTLMVHASLRAIGPVEGGAGGVLDALEEAVSPQGTLLMPLTPGRGRSSCSPGCWDRHPRRSPPARHTTSHGS